VSETIEAQPVTAAAPTTFRSAGHHVARVPIKGERVERRRSGVGLRGTVCYSDQLQLLVKWDDGLSSSLRVDKGHPWPLRTIETDADAA
jgi:hypothetical protein